MRRKKRVGESERGGKSSRGREKVSFAGEKQNLGILEIQVTVLQHPNVKSCEAVSVCVCLPCLCLC